MKRLFVAFAMSALFVTPVFGQADTNLNQNDQELINKFEAAMPYVCDSEIRYTTTEVNIREYPSENAPILDTSIINTEFEVILEIDGWAMITYDGFAYMRSDWFSYEPVEVPTYSQEDLDIMAHLLAGECQSYSDEEQRYVGSVALNRIASSEFPDTLKGVVFQRGQYSCTKDGNYHRQPTERNWANAKWLLENGSVLPEYVLYQSGGKQGKVYLKTKWHYYCYQNSSVKKIGTSIVETGVPFGI